MADISITPYLFFGGRCEEAIEFYKKAVGAEVDMVMLFKDSPEPQPPGVLQPGFEDKVMHSSLRIGGTALMASDGCDDKSVFDGFSLALNLKSEEEAHKMFDGLAVGGVVQMPLSKTFFSPCYGMLKDKFGVAWMFMVRP
jgi:PhnB protein